MKIPQRPPTQHEMSESFVTGWASVGQVLDTVTTGTTDGKYLHWDELRHRTPPSPLSHVQWWWGLKNRRLSHYKTVGLQDNEGSPFKYALIDPLPQHLREVDLQGGGS